MRLLKASKELVLHFKYNFRQSLLPIHTNASIQSYLLFCRNRCKINILVHTRSLMQSIQHLNDDYYVHSGKENSFQEAGLFVACLNDMTALLSISTVHEKVSLWGFHINFLFGKKVISASISGSILLNKQNIFSKLD